MPKPLKNEPKDEYIKRCMSDNEMNSKHPNSDERFAVCSSFFVEYAKTKISFDYDGVLSTDQGKELAKKQKGIIYIISARHDKMSMLNTAHDLGIPTSRVYATGSNKAKIEKIKELGINKHYDNNKDVIDKLGSIGSLYVIYKGPIKLNNIGI